MKRLCRPSEIEKSIKEARRETLIQDAMIRYGNNLPSKKSWNYLSKKARKKLRKQKKKQSQRPKKQWKGDFYMTPAWQALRYRAIKHYGRKCMVCFRTNLELHVDHIKPRSKFPELELVFENLQVLCRDCNKGKSNTDCIDWRPK